MLNGKCFVIVEDEYFIAKDLERTLVAAEATVAAAAPTLEVAARLIEQAAFDAAILDVNLNGAMTFPLADRLRQKKKPFLFMTGYDGWSLPDAYRDAPRVAKPFSPPILLDSLHALFRPAEIGLI